MLNLTYWLLHMKKKLMLGYGEKMDLFFVMESIERKGLLIVKVFLNEIKCRQFISEHNKERGKSLFFE